MEIQRYVVLALLWHYFKVLQSIKLILNNTRGCKKLFPVCKVEILQVTVNKIEIYHLFRYISDDFWLKAPKMARKGTLVSW